MGRGTASLNNQVLPSRGLTVRDCIMANENVEEVRNNIDTSTQQPSVTQEGMNALIGRAKSEAFEKGRRQAEEEFAQRQAELENKRANDMAQATSNEHLSEDAIYQRITERFNQDYEKQQKEFERKQMEAVVDETLHTFNNQLTQGQTKYDDFQTVMQDFDSQAFPNLVYLVSKMENGEDLIYELAKNPKNAHYIEDVSQRSPRMAQAELKKIANSIASNQNALANEEKMRTSPPLNRMQSSNNRSNSGKPTVADFMNDPMCR